MPDLDADVVVVGLGIMGSATLWRLAARGIAAVGIDRHHPPHTFGQSKGESRMLRRVQFEGDQYVALGRLAYELWADLEREIGQAIFRRTGMLVIGPPKSQLIEGGRESARLGGMDIESLDAVALRSRHPQHLVADDEIALFDPEGGYASPDLAIDAMLRLAVAAGASTRLGCAVTSITHGDRDVVLATPEGNVRARQVVVAAGAWLPTLLPQFASAIAIERHCYAHVRVIEPAAFVPERFPVWIRENGANTGLSIHSSHSHKKRIFAFGFPTLDGARVKVGFPVTGAIVELAGMDHEPWPAERQAFESGRLQAVLAGLAPGFEEFTVCHYDNSADFDFIVGPLPASPRITVLGGFSGHGFKHAPAIAECAAALVAGVAPSVDIERFSPARKALTVT